MGWSYAFRSLLGSRVHNSIREDRWGGKSFGPGDIVGLAICLADKDQEVSSEGNIKTYSVAETIVNHIRFFVNGKPTGHQLISHGIKSYDKAFDDIQSGTYYPAVSLYLTGRAKVNFGPYFVYLPIGKSIPNNLKLCPLSDLLKRPCHEHEIYQMWRKGTNNGAVFENFSYIECNIVKSLGESVTKEAKLRRSYYDEHMRGHIQEVMNMRKERSLTTSFLPFKNIVTGIN